MTNQTETMVVPSAVATATATATTTTTGAIISERDRKIIEQGDDSFTPFTWEDLVSIIGM